MKLKIVITLLLLISLIFNPLFCYANSDDFDYGINKTIDADFNDTILIEDKSSSGQSSKLQTTLDFVSLFNRSIIIPAKKIFLR